MFEYTADITQDGEPENIKVFIEEGGVQEDAKVKIQVCDASKDIY